MVIKTELPPRVELESTYQYVRFFDTERSSVSSSPETVGGKASSLIEMTRLGLSVPLGFVISTNAYKEVEANGFMLPASVTHELDTAIAEFERKTNTKADDPDAPTLVSSRSGAQFSMPGMMDTILNIGISDTTLPALIERLGEEGAYDTYCRLIEMYAQSVHDVSPDQFSLGDYTFEQLDEKLARYKQVFHQATGASFPQTLKEQLIPSVLSIFKSWMSPSAVAYRNMYGIPHDLGTAVTIESMVFGNNINGESGTAVIDSRNPQFPNDHVLAGHWRGQAQGEQIVAGTEGNLLDIASAPPVILDQLPQDKLRMIEQMVGGVADIELTWENGTLWILQARKAKLQPTDHLSLLPALVREGVISRRDVLLSITPEMVSTIEKPSFEKAALENTTAIAQGLAGGGIGVGKVCYSVESARAELEQNDKEPIILVADHVDPNDVELLRHIQALVTRKGCPSSHLGLVVKSLGKGCVMGCDSFPQNIQEGDVVSVDGRTGLIYQGEIERASLPEISRETELILNWWHDVFGHDNPWTAFVKPNEAQLEQFKNDALAIYERLKEKYLTVKAVEAKFVADIFPEEIVIPIEIVEVMKRVKDGTTEKIINRTNEAIQKDLIDLIWRHGRKFGLWPRTAYLPDTANSPYVSENFGQSESDTDLSRGISTAEDWCTNPKSPACKVNDKETGLPALRQLPTGEQLAEVIVPKDPDSKLDKNIRHTEFVFSLRAEESKLDIDINDGTILVRSLAEVDPARTMRISTVANSAMPNGLGAISYHFGKDHFNYEKMNELLRSLNSNDVRIKSLTSKLGLHFSPKELNIIDFSKLNNALTQLMNNGLLTPEEFSLFINDRSLQVIGYIHREVLETWLQEYDLPARLWAIKEAVGETQLECQGRLDLDKEKLWILVYGLKGKVESEIAKKQ